MVLFGGCCLVEVGRRVGVGGLKITHSGSRGGISTVSGLVRVSWGCAVNICRCSRDRIYPF